MHNTSPAGRFADAIRFPISRSSKSNRASHVGASRSSNFDFEIGIRFSTEGVVVAYDTDGDGRFDLVRIDADRDGFADRELRRDKAGEWREQELAARTPWLQIALAFPGDGSIGARCRVAKELLAPLFAH